jgi:hypothetical protein
LSIAEEQFLLSFAHYRKDQITKSINIRPIDFFWVPKSQFKIIMCKSFSIKITKENFFTEEFIFKLIT